jgi:phosphohistidine swiveling domain-containing protein
MHVLTFDDRLTGASAGVALRKRAPVSVRHPRAFATLFDGESLYRDVVGGAYPGPDRNPRE